MPAHLEAAFLRDPALRALGFQLGFARVAPPSQEALSSLCEEERQSLATLRVEKRRNEWLAGRLAAKAAVRKCCSAEGLPSPRDLQVQVSSSPAGAPTVSLPPSWAALRGCQVSLSHSGAWACAAAVVARTAPPTIEIGLDLELATPTPLEITELALTGVERERVSSRPERIVELWTAKEAVLKLLRIGLRADLRSLQVEACGREVCVGSAGGRIQRIPIRTFRAGVWVLSIAWKVAGGL